MGSAKQGGGDKEHREDNVEALPLCDLLVALSGSPFPCLCIPLLTCSSFSSGLFDKLPVPMPLVQCPLSAPINSYIYQRFLFTKKEACIIKVIKSDL